MYHSVTINEIALLPLQFSICHVLFTECRKVKFAAYSSIRWYNIYKFHEVRSGCLKAEVQKNRCTDGF